MRGFLGIDFSSDLKKQLYEYQREFRSFADRGRWKHIDNFHVTIKFFNEIGPSQKKYLDEAIKQLCSDRSPFFLELSHIGIFPGKDSVRTLWLGLKGDIERLQELQEEIDKASELHSFVRENRKYTPHITLAQDIIFDRSFEEVKSIIGEPRFPAITVDRIFLFRSEQIQNRRVYTKVSEYVF